MQISEIRPGSTIRFNGSGGHNARIHEVVSMHSPLNTAHYPKGFVVLTLSDGTATWSTAALDPTRHIAGHAVSR